MDELEYTRNRVAERMGKEQTHRYQLHPPAEAAPISGGGSQRRTGNMGHARALINVDLVDKQSSSSRR